jgi:hypothetical protein
LLGHRSRNANRWEGKGVCRKWNTLFPFWDWKFCLSFQALSGSRGAVAAPVKQFPGPSPPKREYLRTLTNDVWRIPNHAFRFLWPQEMFSLVNRCKSKRDRLGNVFHDFMNARCEKI